MKIEENNKKAGYDSGDANGAGSETLSTYTALGADVSISSVSFMPSKILSMYVPK